ncbi:MAG: hypothetical protein QM805_07665 [Pseudomonas sp.]
MARKARAIKAKEEPEVVAVDVPEEYTACNICPYPGDCIRNRQCSRKMK